MSSLYVRDTITAFVESSVTDRVIDLSGRFEDLKDLIEEAGLTPETNWIGLEFTGNDEVGITAGSTNVVGKYRETGAVAIHVVGIAGLGRARDVIERADDLRFKLRGNRLGRMVIESVAPANTDSGSSLNLTQGYFSASFLLEYFCDTDL